MIHRMDCWANGDEVWFRVSAESDDTTRSNYAYLTPEQAKAILKMLEGAIETAERNKATNK